MPAPRANDVSTSADADAGSRKAPLDEVTLPPADPEPERSGSNLRSLLLAAGLLVFAGFGVLFAMRDGASSPATVAVSAPSGPAASPEPATDAPIVLDEPAPLDLSAAPALVTAPAPLPATASLEDVVSRILPAVGSITAGQSRGTGFFIRPDQVLTNAHVVQGHTSVTLQVGSTTLQRTRDDGLDRQRPRAPAGVQREPQSARPVDGLGIPRTCRTGGHRRRLGAWRPLEHGDARHRQRSAGKSATSRCSRRMPPSIQATAEDRWSIARVW